MSAGPGPSGSPIWFGSSEHGDHVVRSTLRPQKSRAALAGRHEKLLCRSRPSIQRRERLRGHCVCSRLHNAGKKDSVNGLCGKLLSVCWRKGGEERPEASLIAVAKAGRNVFPRETNGGLRGSPARMGGSQVRCSRVVYLYRHAARRGK